MGLGAEGDRIGWQRSVWSTDSTPYTPLDPIIASYLPTHFLS